MRPTKLRRSPRFRHSTFENVHLAEVYSNKLRKIKFFKNQDRSLYRIPHVKEAYKYLPGASKLVQLACDIYLAQDLKDLNTIKRIGINREKRILDAVERFEEFDHDTLSYYLIAALVSDPERAEEIASYAFHNFLLLHNQKLRQHLETKNNEIRISPVIQRSAKCLWNSMRAEHKFPFFLLAYFNTYFPNESLNKDNANGGGDGADNKENIAIEHISDNEINTETLSKAEETIKTYWINLS